MPRQRMIRPEFFDSESLSECSPVARLAFIGLWVMGDDNGNLKLCPKKLNRQIFPEDGFAVETFTDFLRELEDVGCIKIYEVDGEAYINIVNFKVYQTVNRPSKTNIPEPPESLSKHKITTYFSNHSNTDDPSLNTHGALTDDSLTHEHSVSTHGALMLKKERSKERSKDLIPKDNMSGGPKTAPPYGEIVAYLNAKTGASFKPDTKETRQLIKARWREGFTLEDFKTVIDKKFDEWNDSPKMCKFLRPQTLFGTKFESYLNEQPANPTKGGGKNDCFLSPEYRR